MTDLPDSNPPESNGQESNTLPHTSIFQAARSRWLGITPWNALIAIFIVTLRLWSIAHMNPAVALSLVQLTSVSNVLFGLAVVVFPTIVICSGLYVHFICTEYLTIFTKNARSHIKYDPPDRLLAYFLLWPPVATIAVAFVPVFPGVLILAGIVILSIARVVTGSKPELKKPENASTRSSPHVPPSSPGLPVGRMQGISYKLRFVYIAIGIVACCIGFAMLAFDDAPWMPAERISLTSGQVVVGYVVAQSDSDLSVLRDSDRDLILIPLAQVRSTELCGTNGDHYIAQLFWRYNPPNISCY
jgi:hypothetical protein